MTDESGAISIPFSALPMNLYIKGKPCYIHLGDGPRPSDAEIERMQNEQDALEAKYSVPQWDKYRKMNSEPSPACKEITRRCRISFAEHLNKPLTDRLWRAIVFTLKPEELWILGPGDYEHEHGFAAPTMNIYLDEAGLVRDIHYDLFG